MELGLYVRLGRPFMRQRASTSSNRPQNRLAQLSFYDWWNG